MHTLSFVAHELATFFLFCFRILNDRTYNNIAHTEYSRAQNQQYVKGRIEIFKQNSARSALKDKDEANKFTKSTSIPTNKYIHLEFKGKSVVLYLHVM